MRELIKSNIGTIFENEELTKDTDNSFHLLIQYYHSLDDLGKTIFEDIVVNYNISDTIEIDGDGNIIIDWYSTLCVKTVLYIWKIKEFINIQSDKNTILWYKLLSDIDEILWLIEWEDKNLYGDKLKYILGKLNPYFYYDRQKQIIFDYIKGINKKLLDWKIWNIKVKVNQVDVEIESDQNKVIELIEEFWFDPQLNKFLTDLRNKNIAEEDELQFAWTIGTFRDFFGRVIIEIAQKIAEFSSEIIPEYEWITSPISIARKYIQDKWSLSDKENKFINDYIEILHKEWWHNMFSNKDYFRLTKNIGIEILYMLLSKTKEFKK